VAAHIMPAAPAPTTIASKRGAPGEEIPHRLPRRGIRLAARHEGQRFPVALERDAREWPIGIIPRRIDTDDEAGIGVEFGAAILAHAIGDDAPFLRCRGDHAPAGAHAEAVHCAAIGASGGEAVRRRAQIRVARTTAITRLIDPALRMLDPHADGEGLGLDMHPAGVQHLEGRAGAVADGEHDMIGFEEAAIVQVQPAQALFAIAHPIQRDVVHPRLPAIFSAQFLDRAADALHHRHEAEGADMRMRLPQDVVRRAPP
jgi:hypothetical protein